MSTTNDEREMLVWMSYLMIAASLIVAVLLKFIAAPYGRYSPSFSHYTLSARLAWLIQESPAVVIPILVWGYASSSPNFMNKIFLGLFLIHYIHR